MNAKQAFTVPGTATNYAVEELYLGAPDPSSSAEAYRGNIKKLIVLVEDLPTAADIEVDVLKAKADPGVGASWVTVATYSATGLQTILDLLRWPGVRLRAVSGGNSGTANITVIYE